MQEEQLLAFAQVAELGSVSAASRRLALRQSTASRRIASLEHEVGVSLLRRTPAGTLLTDAGRAFNDRLPALLASFERARAAAGDHRRGRTPE